MSIPCARIHIMASNAVVTGPTAERVAKNIERIRKARQLKQKDLSDLLGRLGRPTLPTVISKIERGERRIDVDDVVAFALALNVSPLTLLLPPTSSDETVDLTASQEVTSRTAWYWGVGRRPAMDWEPGAAANLAGPGVDPAIATEAYEREQEYAGQQAEYTALTLPPELRRVTDNQAVRTARQLLELVEDLTSPEPSADRAAQAALVRMARRRYESLGIELEELQEQFDPRPIVHPGEQYRRNTERWQTLEGDSDETDRDNPGGKR
jgi:transcriptional regulator with XRE-family HTH domain